MGTRSFIVVANPKGDYTGIYCHWDGYPSHNGKLLREHYTTKRLVRNLVNLGDLSSLGERLRPTRPGHSYDNREEGTTVAYFRDRKEKWVVVKPRVTATLREMAELAADSWAEYVYVFWNGHWSYQTPRAIIDGEALIPLTEENTKREEA